MTLVEMPGKDVPPPLELVKSRIEELLPTDARQRVLSDDVVVIDTRDRERYERGHLAGAISLPSGESARDAYDQDYARAVERAAGGREREIILYCGEGNRSARTADALINEHDFERVASLIGGVKLWSELGYPIEGALAAGPDEAEVALSGGDGDTT